MDYEKEYKAALERAKQGMPIDEVFPDLKESDDERIRKSLVEFFRNFKPKDMWDEMFSFGDVLSYLEKQKEQKPNVELIQKSWYLEGYHDGKYNNEPKWLIQTGKGGPMYEENPKYGTQQPAEWSEEDEKILESIVIYGALDDEQITWLKSLRPQSRWKPSKEQMEALMWQVKNTSEGSWQRRASEELYNDLLKLL